MCTATCLRSTVTSISIVLAFFILQTHRIRHHRSTENVHDQADIHKFVKHFELFPFSRTTLHEKGIDYWFDWIQYESNMLTFNKTLTLLHIDPHGLEDNANEPFHICTAPNLFVYDFFVQQSLDAASSAYFEDWNEYGNGSVTRHALRKGLVNNIVWIYPDHWTNYSQTSVMGTPMDEFRAIIRHQTYYIHPNHTHFLYLLRDTNTENPVWNGIFHRESNKEIFQSVDHRLDPDDYLEIHIWTLSLSEYLEETVFVEMETNNLIVDIDLDFFQCQEPAITFMDHHGWTSDVVSRFNDILGHHQYIPTHLPSEHSTEAIVTLIHLLNDKNAENTENVEIPKFEGIHSSKSSDDRTERSHFPMPSVETVFGVALREGMGS